jgi:hypothetical protein
MTIRIELHPAGSRGAQKIGESQRRGNSIALSPFGPSHTGGNDGVAARLRSPAGTVHGGLAPTLLDSCIGLDIESPLENGIAQTTPEFKVPPPAAHYAGNRADNGRGGRIECK